MSDVNCPYCGAEQEINHDDGHGYAEDVKHEQQCGECEKYFVFTTFIHFSYDVEKADCLNGEPHELEKVIHYPICWPDWVKCNNCAYSHQGKYDPKANK